MFAPQEFSDQDLAMWQAIKEWLGRDSNGQEILTQLEANPQAAARIVTERLEGSTVPTALSTYVTGGNIGKLAAIARAERVYIGGATAPLALHQLPADVADFTDREAEQTMLMDAFQPGGASVCVVSGRPGVGKSALALHVAHRLCDEYPDVQLYSNLRGADAEPLAPDAVLAAFLRDLGVADEVVPAELSARSALYRSLLSDKRALIVLDNVRDERQISPLLPGGGRCSVLITSRSRLVALPGAVLCALADIGGDEAIELLGHLAGHDRLRSEREATERIVELCGGLPLALRIAGAILKSRPHWTAARLAERLGDNRRRLDLLRVGDLDVRTSFDLSYRALESEDARVFRFLGVLPGPDFSWDLVAALLDCPPDEAEEALDRLHETQLLDVLEDGRYRFHDLLRAFAQERLRAEEGSIEQADAVERMLLWYLETAREAAARITSLETGIPASTTGRKLIDIAAQQSALAWFDTERLALVPAVAQACETERWELAVGIAQALIAFFAMRTFWSDEQRVQELALRSARQLGDRHGEGRILSNLGRVYAKQGKWPEAIDHYGRGRDILRDLGDRHDEARSLVGSGEVYCHRGRWEEAIDAFEQSRAIFGELGDRSGEGDALMGLAQVFWYQTRWDEAISHNEQALAIVRSVGDRHREGQALVGLGKVYREQARREQAIECHQRAQVIFHELGDELHEAEALHSLGNVRRDQGQWNEAQRCYETGLAMRRELGDRAGESWSLAQLGHLKRDQGIFQDALTWYRQALDVIRQLGYRDAEGWAIAGTGICHLNLGDPEQGRAALEEAIGIFRELGDREGEARELPNLALVLLGLGLADEALPTCERGLAVCRELRDSHGEGLALIKLARVRGERGEWAGAATTLTTAIRVFERIGDSLRADQARGELETARRRAGPI